MAEIIDINVSEVVENVQITTTENITTVNINEVAGSGAVWGAISGNLSNQTDLQDALDLKANVSELGATAFSNNYNDLANKPIIPTLTSQLTNNSGFITNVITALGFTPENSANKSTSVTTDSASNTKYPSVKAVFDWANSVFTTPSAVATQITTAINSNKTSFTHNILVSNWTLVSGKYEAAISNAGILANSFVDVIPSNDNVDIVRNAQIYPSVLISAGSVKVYSKFLPSGTISVTVNII